MKYFSITVFGLLLLGFSLVLTLLSLYYLQLEQGEWYYSIVFLLFVSFCGIGFLLIKFGTKKLKNYPDSRKKKELMLYINLHNGRARASDAAQYTDLTKFEAAELLNKFSDEGITVKQESDNEDPVFVLKTDKLSV